MKQQLADIASLGDEEEREELQEMLTEVILGRHKHMFNQNKLFACILICAALLICMHRR